jgi:hypothetical protein
MRSLIVAAVLALPSIVVGKGVTLSLGSAVAKPGWTVDLPITLSGGAQPAALQWSLGFSPDVTGVTVVAGPSAKAAGKAVSCSANTCLLFGVNKAIIADGVIATATFQIAANPSATTIEITVKSVVAAKLDGSSISASGIAGKVTLPGGSSAPGRPLEWNAKLLKFSPEPVDEPNMERRLHPRAQVHFEAKLTAVETKQTGVGRTSDISESGISVVLPFSLDEGNAVRLEMADSIVTGRVAYSKPEGAEFRVGIEVERVELGNSSLSILLQQTLADTMPLVPGVEHAEHQLG